MFLGYWIKASNSEGHKHERHAHSRGKEFFVGLGMGSEPFLK